MSKIEFSEIETKNLNCGWCAVGFVGGAGVAAGIGWGIVALT